MLQKRIALALLTTWVAGCAEVTDISAPGSTLEQVPSSSFMVLSLQQPEQSINRLRQALSDIGALSHPRVEAALESIGRSFGVNPLQPESLRQRGIDPSRAILFAQDELLVYQGSDQEPYPASYLVFAVSDAGALRTWLRGLVSQKLPEATFLEEPLDGATVAYASDGGKILYALVERGEFAYLFTPGMYGGAPEGAAREDFGRGLAAFLARADTPLFTDPTFQDVTRKLADRPDIFYYKDEARAQAAKERTRESIEGAGAGLARSPVEAEASGVWFETEEIGFQGVQRIKPAFRDLLQRALGEGAEILPPEIFPPDTALFGRLSLNPRAAKDLLFAVLSEDFRPVFREMWQGLDEEVRAKTGLDLEEDVLFAFAGELALGMPTPSVTDLVAAQGDLRVLSPVILAARLESPEAGERLLSAIAARAEERAKEGGAPLRTEEYDGLILYTVEDPTNPLAWGRVSDILVVGFDADAVLDAMRRGSLREGPSFVNKLPLFARDIPVAQAKSGFTVDLGALFSDISQLLPPQEGKILSEIGARVGALSFKGFYADGWIEATGELLVK